MRVLLLLGCMVLPLFSGPAHATHFTENPYREYTGPLASAVGKIGCLSIPASNGEGTAVHLGQGHILTSAHKDFSNCGGWFVFVPRAGRDAGARLLLQPEYQCDRGLDYCLFEIFDPYFIPAEKVDLSTEPPPLFSDLFFVGFPSDSPFNVTAASGQIVREEREEELGSPELRVPLYANSITWYAGGSNSPVVLATDPSLMVLFQDGFTRQNEQVPYETTQSEALALAAGQDLWNFNYGVGAYRIAASLLSSEVTQAYFAPGEKRLLAKTSKDALLFGENETYGMRKEYGWYKDSTLEEARQELLEAYCFALKKKKQNVSAALSFLQTNLGLRVSGFEINKLLESAGETVCE